MDDKDPSIAVAKKIAAVRSDSSMDDKDAFGFRRCSGMMCVQIPLWTIRTMHIDRLCGR